MIISNHEKLRNIAEMFNVPFHYLPITKETKLQQESQVIELLDSNEIDLVIMARYMQILSSNFINHYPERIINIHHSFLPAFQGAKIGMGLARKAIDARKVGNYAQLSRFGKIINNVKNSQLAAGIGGAAVGEAIVSDEDIGTLGDMLRGTALEPFAITMMDTEQKEGRAEAYRKLTNRLKFGVDGSLFNLGIAGAGKGISAIRRPSKTGLQRYAENDLKQIYNALLSLL